MPGRGLKIAVASSGLGHVTRGIEAWAADVAAAMAERGVDVTLFKGAGAQRADYERVLRCLRRGDAHTRLIADSLPRGLWRIGLASPYDLEQATFAMRLLPRLRLENFDIVHVQEARLAWLVQRANRLGLVRTRPILGHGTNEPTEFLNRVNYLQHLSPWHAEQVRSAGVWRPSWTTIPNFVDTNLFHPGKAERLRAELGIPSNAVVFLTAAAIKRTHKRVDHLLEEFRRLISAAPDLPVRLVVAGGREQDTDELIELGKKTLGDRVRFLPCFPRERMAELYRACDAFVLCSLREMMPVAMLEATASGLPCLVHTHPVLQWIAGPGGESIDMASPGVLASAMQRLAADQLRRNHLGANARRHCMEHFSPDQVVGQMLRYYQFVHSHDRSREPATSPSDAPAVSPQHTVAC